MPNLICRAGLAAPVLLAVLAVPTAHAEDGEVLVVTALRAPIEADRVPSSVSVIDQSGLDRAQPLALSDVLVTVPGVTLSRAGGYGQVTSLRIRGAAPGQTVLVIDGMRMADATATDGGFDFAQLFADDAARVEVLRGPQSVLWGSDAIGGIVHITTAHPNRPLGADWAVEAGSHQTVSARGGIGGTSDRIDWRVAASTFSTDGIPTIAGGTVPNGYHRDAASGTLTVRLTPDLSLDLRGYWDAGRNSFSDTFSLPSGIYAGDYATTAQWSAYAGLNWALTGGKWKNRLAVLENHTNSEDFDPANLAYGSPALTFEGHGRVRRYEYQGTLDLARGVQTVFGAEREEARMRVGSPYDLVMPYDLAEHRADTDSLYAELRVQPLPGLSAMGGLRYDHQAQFGGNTVFSGGAAYTPDQGVTVLRANYAQGFKAPSLYQQFSDYGSAGLRPEHAHGWELGAERGLLGDHLRLGAVWWQRATNDLIDFASCPFSGPLPAVCYVPGTAIARYGYYINVDAARGHGLELTGHAQWGRLFADGHYGVVVNENRTPGAVDEGRQLPRVPRHEAQGSLGYAVPDRGSMTVSVRWAGASFDNAYATDPLAGYAVVDWRGEVQVARAFTLYARVENIGNRHYQTVAGYNTLGRTATAGVRGRF